MRKIRVFELAKVKNLSINRTVELLGQKGIANASAITYVDADALNELPDAVPQTAAAASPPLPPKAPSPNDSAELRGAALAQRLLRREQEGGEPAGRRESGAGGMTALVSVALSVATLALVAFVFLSERDDRVQLRQLSEQVAAMKSSTDKVEELVVNNRAQIMEMRDQVSGMEKRIYEFKRSSLLTQLKSQGVVLKALSENLKEPLKGKALSLSSHLSQF